MSTPLSSPPPSRGGDKKRVQPTLKPDFENAFQEPLSLENAKKRFAGREKKKPPPVSYLKKGRVKDLNDIQGKGFRVTVDNANRCSLPRLVAPSHQKALRAYRQASSPHLSGENLNG